MQHSILAPELIERFLYYFFLLLFVLNTRTEFRRLSALAIEGMACIWQHQLKFKSSPFVMNSGKYNFGLD